MGRGIEGVKAVLIIDVISTAVLYSVISGCRQRASGGKSHLVRRCSKLDRRVDIRIGGGREVAGVTVNTVSVSEV